MAGESIYFYGVIVIMLRVSCVGALPSASSGSLEGVSQSFAAIHMYEDQKGDAGAPCGILLQLVVRVR